MSEELREKVKQRYAGAALTVLEGTGGYGDTVTTAAATASSEVPLASAFVRGRKPAGADMVTP
jgi:hypothetical protein